MTEKFTYDEAVAMLPEGDNVHTFRGGGFTMLGADWRREHVIDALREADEIRRAGEVATSLGHPLAIRNNGGWLFIEATLGDEP